MQKNLEIQQIQLAQTQNARPQGGLPVDTKQNPKQVMANTFGSGRYLIDVSLKNKHKVHTKLITPKQRKN